MSNSDVKRDRQRINLNRQEIIERMLQALPEDGVKEVFPGLFFNRASAVTQPIHVIFEPAFCVIVQGSKEVALGEEVFRYDPGHYLISSVDLPITSHLAEASPEKPYLSLRLRLDPIVVNSVMVESGIETKKSDAQSQAINVSPIDADLLDAVVKLAKMLDTPKDIKFLAPLVIREIIYRLLQGKQAAQFSHLITPEGDTRRIAKAVRELRQNIDKPLVIEDIARELGMSVSSFHHHFKSVTAMSPLQYQKQIRLQEARRLMLSENYNVANASFRVGYEDPGYFTREYKKLFGVPPQRDLAKLRSNIGQQ